MAAISCGSRFVSARCFARLGRLGGIVCVVCVCGEGLWRRWIGCEGEVIHVREMLI